MLGLLDTVFDSHSQRVQDYCCENCGNVGFCTTFSSVSSIAERLIMQLVIFRYNPMNKRSRKRIPNIKTDNMVTLFKKLNNLSIQWNQGPSTRYGHYTCMFKVNDKGFFVSDV